jgi:hypothetical protein
MIPTLPMITTIIANPAGKADQNENKDDYESDNIEDRDIDNLKKLRINQHLHIGKQDDCIDDFITHHVTPELKRRPTYEECLDEQNEDDPLQLNAAVIQPSTTESSSSLTPQAESKKFSLVTQVSRHLDAFLRQQDASDLMIS